MLGTNWYTNLRLQETKMMVTTLGYVYVYLTGTYEGINTEWQYCSNDGTTDGALDGLLLGF